MAIEKLPSRRESQAGASTSSVSPGGNSPCLRLPSASSHAFSSHSKSSEIPTTMQPLQQTPSMRQRLGKLTKQALSMKVDIGGMAMSCVRSIYAGMSPLRLFIIFSILAVIVYGLLTLPVEEMLKSFVLWLKHVGPWGPFIMAIAYIPLNVLALPASILTLGGGYVFGLLVGFAADSIGSTIGATAAFLVGKTLCRKYVTAKLKEYPQFQVIAHAISKSGFKIVLLLRLVPILPFNILNYVLSVTPISVWSYMLASWLGMMPVTFAFVYLGTTIKDISEIGTPEAALGARHWWIMGFGLVLTVVSTVLITRVARDALEKAIEEHHLSTEDLGFKISGSPPPPTVRSRSPKPTAGAAKENTKPSGKGGEEGEVQVLEKKGSIGVQIEAGGAAG